MDQDSYLDLVRMGFEEVSERLQLSLTGRSDIEDRHIDH